MVPVHAKLTVCRRLDNRLEGKDDRSPRALELHRLRAQALHDVLDNDPAFSFSNWEQVDDEKPHEWVEIYGWIGEYGQQVSTVAIPALKYIADALLQAGIGAAGVAGIVRLFQKVRKKQIDGYCRNLELHVPNRVDISLHPDEGALTVALHSSVSLLFDATEGDVVKLAGERSELLEVPADLVPFVRNLIAQRQTE